MICRLSLSDFGFYSLFVMFTCLHEEPCHPGKQLSSSANRERWVMVMGDTETEDKALAWHLGSIFHLFFSANPSAKIRHS
jgi:hypothetical protein